MQAGKKSPRLTQVGGANSDASAFAAWFFYCMFSYTILAGASVELERCMNFLVFSLFFDTILACGDARVAVGAWSDGHQ